MIEERYHHGDLRQALLAIAKQQLTSHGFEALSLRAISREAGVSHAAAYRHFPNKEALVAALACAGFEQLQAFVETEVIKYGADPREQFFQCGIAYVKFALHNAPLFRVMFGVSGVDRLHYPATHAAAQASFGVLVGTIQRGQAAGLIGAGEPRQLAFTAWAAVHGLATLALQDQITSQQGVIDSERLVRNSAKLLWNGLKYGQT
ncbi:TetR/AcrR family transcriptional regulator [Herpetosiphon llansteffanensis]